MGMQKFQMKNLKESIKQWIQDKPFLETLEKQISFHDLSFIVYQQATKIRFLIHYYKAHVCVNNVILMKCTLQ